MENEGVEKKEVLLFSGGMDSLIAWEFLGQPASLYVDFGHKYAKQESERVRTIGPKDRVLVYSGMKFGVFERDDAEIPQRNMYLAMLAANFGYDKIWIIAQKDEMSIPDRTPEFYQKASEMLTLLNEREIIVATPFEDMDKTDMVAWWLNEGHSAETLLKTWACYHPWKGEPCGNCGACLRRYVAFKNNDIDPGYELKAEIKAEYTDKLASYSDDRRERMEPWLL